MHLERAYESNRPSMPTSFTVAGVERVQSESSTATTHPRAPCVVVPGPIHVTTDRYRR